MCGWEASNSVFCTSESMGVHVFFLGQLYSHGMSNKDVALYVYISLYVSDKHTRIVIINRMCQPL